jgi:hypothetical protein
MWIMWAAFLGRDSSSAGLLGGGIWNLHQVVGRAATFSSVV